MNRYAVIIPAYNEEGAIAGTISGLKSEFAKLGREAEIIIVDDGSTDATAARAEAAGAGVLRNPINSGYGFSLKRGIAAAANPDIVIIDADATYPIEELPKLVAEYERGFDMVVGQRTGKEYRRGLLKYPARLVFAAIVEFATGRKIPDINSGFRIFRKAVAERFRRDLCNGFSFTTTITLLSMLQGYFVSYVPIPYRKRLGASKVRHLRDSLRVLQFIVQAIILYNPIKLFLLLASAEVILGLLGLVVAGAYGRWAAGWIFAAIFAVGAFLTFGLGLAADILAKMRLDSDDKPPAKD